MGAEKNGNAHYESEVYRLIVLAVANSFHNTRVRAGIVVKPTIETGLYKQVNSLLGLERKFSCDLNSTRYAQVFAQTLANITGTKATIIQSESSVTEMEAEYNRFLTVAEGELAVKPSVFKDETVSLQVASFKSFRFLSFQEAQKILAPKEQRPQAHVDQQTNSTSSENQQSQRTAGKDMKMNFARNMFWNSAKIPGGNFPRHPLYDPKFYPYKTKSSYFPILKWVVAGFCILASLFSFLVMILCMLKPITINVAGWGVKDGYIITSGGRGQVMLYLSPLKGIMGYNWFSVIIAIVPGAMIGFMSFYNQKWDRNRYTIGYFRAGIAIAAYAVSLYSLLIFLIPISFRRYLATLFQGGQPSSNNLSLLLRSVVGNGFYKVIWIFSLLTTVLVFISIASLVMLLFCNPKIDRDKVMRANGEYQKAVAARYNGQEYEIDPSLFDPTPIKKRKSKTSSVRN